MWLVNTTTHRLEQVVDEKQCRFVILSHTWAPEGEVTFQDMQDVENVASKKPGFEKITRTCNIAWHTSKNKYVWIDTCCIDKTSSAELSEAINSMFRWYRNAESCYVFLSDFDPLPLVPIKEKERLAMVAERLRGCRWFTRGWTLQELIAPRIVDFFDRKWNFLGAKTDLVKPLYHITSIDESVLRDSSRLHNIPVARRMSWAAGRETTRAEDMAYCLLGIFDINMPLLYGEGSKAFLRLQQQIASENADLSLFAWQCAQKCEYSGLFADSPSDFAQCAQLRAFQAQWFSNEIAITNIGVRLNVALHSPGPSARGVVLSLNCIKVEEGSAKWVAIRLRKFEQTYVRWRPFEVELSEHKRHRPTLGAASPIYVHPRLLPGDVQRISALLENVIVVRYDEGLVELVNFREGQPVAVYLETPMLARRGATHHDPAADVPSADRIPEGLKEIWSNEQLANPYGGAIFRTQETEGFVGVHTIDVKLGPKTEDIQRMILVVCLQWNGLRLSLNYGLYNDAPGPAGDLMRRISRSPGSTEQDCEQGCLEEVRGFLLAHCSDLSGLLRQRSMPVSVDLFSSSHPRTRVRIIAEEEYSSLLSRSKDYFYVYLRVRDISISVNGEWLDAREVMGSNPTIEAADNPRQAPPTEDGAQE